MIKIIECPRDAMQGLSNFIPTQTKIEYLNLLLEVGFDTLDFGSFVSPKAIPQMKDTKEVLAGLNLNKSATKLLAIVVNKRGAEEAAKYDEITYLGFPLSVSETFQQRNTKKSISEAKLMLKDIISICKENNKEPVVYLSMSFGNPYNEDISFDKVLKMALDLKEMGVKIISFADTIGKASVKDIQDLFEKASKILPNTELGVHLHCNPNMAFDLAKASLEAGCLRIDTAIGGLGGCPMAKDDLTGNLATEYLIQALTDLPAFRPSINEDKFQEAVAFQKRYIG
ncbi:hydroxymethylglutaryl-CoA lyase [Flammeovirga pectinis]|uniref:Hydroxymethylglutaryl-CoA lyase n=1 Tax=Flammeovirga pectinis TaxID=2494373 RepID=A0A3Q9FM99_9BACT|nr:hydroxymethylglutaryl-CoA lyase [Flammeovirga pectinis]AZQ61459.1 hydroxymethylglutaryl-CoA lyase [Flammeovirga pectinis]